ncbi:Clr6 histone deacetylase complex subunit Prw1 [Schizosaccharomyces octosporus yFS286]|uniref:Clr6 histone deacetylase complex subunit Prw1 n=1 Tax=Schizosaccharomyces octosporus (strain yFS286) TaxID=483514 RepID=S9RGT8_SCHOY|nr:Clr6 histone deacetylase complex subunit Prw1 [Schizosaccharomyces octosporus yFS286]EPX73269.1 Clr6 histone deacetylase complex subunit Prw1 [Schizosaccharomyces octosporus yFS286]
MAVSATAQSAKQVQASEEAINQEKCINEEYKIWKKNSPFLYDLIITRALEWPCVSLQWYPDQQLFPEHGYTEQNVLLGVRADAGKYYLAIAGIQLPYLNQNTNPTSMEKDEQENSLRVNVRELYSHPESISKATLMPQKTSHVATIGNNHNNVLVFNDSSFSSYNSTHENPIRPAMNLQKHDLPCTSLCWNYMKQGQLVSGSRDSTICHWDIEHYNESNPSAALMSQISTHEQPINDVKYHFKHGDIFASVSSDQHLHLHDSRRADYSTTPLKSIHAHSSDVNAVAFNPLNDFIMATCSADKTIALWDLRNLNNRLYTLEGHEDHVSNVKFSPHEEPVLVSTSVDRRTLLWDLSRIGEDQSAEEAQDGPPELLFMHGGHTSCTIDMDWCPNYNWTLATAAEDNILQLWTPSRSIWGNQHLEEDAQAA